MGERVRRRAQGYVAGDQLAALGYTLGSAKPLSLGLYVDDAFLNNAVRRACAAAGAWRGGMAGATECGAALCE